MLLFNISFNSLILPRKTVFQLCSLLAETNEQLMMQTGDNKIIFRVGKMKLISKVIDGKFPDYKKVVPTENTKVLLISSSEFINSIERVTSVSQDRKEGIKLSSNKYMYVHYSDCEYEISTCLSMINLAEKNNLDAVFGSRIMHNEDYFYYKINRFAVINLTKMINFLLTGSFTDVATNHKLIKTNVLKKLNLKSKGFNLDFEIAIKLL